MNKKNSISCNLCNQYENLKYNCDGCKTLCYKKMFYKHGIMLVL